MANKVAWILGFIVAALLLVIYLIKCTGSKDYIPTGSKVDSTVKWKSLNGDSVYSLLIESRQQYSSMDQHYRDSIGKLLRVSKGKIDQLTVAATRSTATLTPDTVTTVSYVDTSGPCPPRIAFMEKTFRSKFYTVKAKIGVGAYAIVEHWDTVTHAISDVSEGNIFNRRNYKKIDLKFADQANQVEGLRTFVVPVPKPKKWSIGPYVGWGYALDKSLKGSVQIGLSVQYGFIRF